MNGALRILFLCVVMVLVGCTSPLKSDNPARRMEAVAELSDEKELFFIAMNIGVSIGLRNGSYYNAFLTEENYADDVRVAAVQRLSNTDYLLCCASWQDGDRYADSGLEQGCLKFKGEDYHVHDADSRLIVKVKPGDAVRSAAIRRLTTPEIFRRSARSFLETENQSSVRTRLFPSCRHWTGSSWSDGGETAFVDYYGQIKKDNPIDRAIVKAIEGQFSSEAVVEFLLEAGDNGLSIAPKAYEVGIGQVSAVSSDMATRLFRKMFVRSKGSVPDELKPGAMKVFSMIDNPDAEIVMTALRLSSFVDIPNVLGKVSQSDVLAKVLCDKKLIEIVPHNARRELYCPLDVIKADMRPDIAKRLVEQVKDSAMLGEVAVGAAFFSVRLAAVKQLSDDCQLARIALDSMKDCPFDTSLPKYDLISNRIDWWNFTEKKSAMQIRRLAVSKMSDVTALRRVRKSTEDDEIKKEASARLVALGASDVATILAATVYDKDLFSMLDELKDRGEIERVAKESKLKGVRVMAASKLTHDACAAFARKECAAFSSRCPEGRIDIGGFFLGMNIEDALSLLVSRFHDVRPCLYLDGNVLCIADANKRDMVWANVESREVHWLTLPPQIVRQIVGFKSGTYAELEGTVQSSLSVNFKMNVISKGDVRQQIGEVETVDGESLRYFKSEVKKGENFKRSVRKSIREDIALADPMSGGLGAVFVNAIEDAQQADENTSNARSPRFAEQGSLQLQWTKNAVKGEY